MRLMASRNVGFFPDTIFRVQVPGGNIVSSSCVTFFGLSQSLHWCT